MTIRRSRLSGHLRRPSAVEIDEVLAAEGIRLDPDASAAMTAFIGDTLEMLDVVEDLPPLEPERLFPGRDPGRIPRPEENPFNAFVRFCRVEGAATGVLAGRQIAVKDNLGIAGIPTSNASRTMPFTPQHDAVVVERILSAGGTIVGKLNLDNLSAGAFGESSHLGPPRNPRDERRSPGGSSGGAGAAVASGVVDMALGVDEGGSARIPAAFCGCVAIKATHGLVPSFGLDTYFDHTIDSICPMGRTVADVADLLAAIAGADWRDPQWVRGSIDIAPYADAAGRGVEGLRVGILEEMLDPELCQQAVLGGVTHARAALEDAGAIVETISVPRLEFTSAIWFGVVLGAAPAMMRSDGLGYNHLGYVDVDRVQLAGISRRAETSSYGVFVQSLLAANRYLVDRYGHAFFAQAHNQRLALRREVDDALTSVDLLLTPTSPTTAPMLPTTRLSPSEQIRRLPDAGVHFPFTQAFNLTGHPALVMPSGVDSDGLPTSVQLVGPHFAEDRVFRAAFALERAGLSAAALYPDETPRSHR